MPGRRGRDRAPVSRVEASAPGKLLLLGEYAVLEGAPALVAAVDRRARVRLRSGGSTAGRITCTPLGVDRAPFQVRDRRLVCRDCNAARLGLTAALVPRLFEAFGQPAEAATEFEIDIDSTALFERAEDGARVKLGLGSSAAVAAALIAAFEAALEPGWDASAPARLRRWLPLYRELLGGHASGADLAAAFAGGLAGYRDRPDTGPVVASRRWPEGLAWLPVWVGRPALTTDFVAGFESWRAGSPERAGGLIGRLTALAAKADAALDCPAAFIEAVAAYAAGIGELGAEAGLDIVSAPHRVLAEAGGRLGVVYKSCGAGGGDLGVALDADPDRLRAFARAAARAGAVPLNLVLAETGADRESAWGGFAGS